MCPKNKDKINATIYTSEMSYQLTLKWLPLISPRYWQCHINGMLESQNGERRYMEF